MPKLIQINTVCNGSTGKIMGDIQRKYNSEGYETLSIFGRRKPFKDLNCIKIGGFFSFWFHVFLTTVFDLQGRGSYFKTKKIVKILRKESPDIIHLHNIHGYYLNYPVLFKYLKNEFKGEIRWTFHDFWPMTGHCPYFSIANCDKWKIICKNCPNKKMYPTSLFWDNSKRNYLLKKQMFTGFKNLTIICPSQWGKNLVQKSFFKENHIEVINNGIDLSTFKKVNTQSINKKYNLKNKKVLLGVANVWDERKGLNEFISISKQLNNNYVIILVGLNSKQIKKIKDSNIIGIKRTENVSELVELYSRADIFVNPSKEETFSMVTIEALACSTPVIVYKNTPMELFINGKNGISVDKINIKNIDKVLNMKNYKFDDIKNYDLNNMKNDYFKLGRNR